ncbi:hypothetical protein ABZ470_39700 [Streptosporangium sp. NPDC020072]|uniref:hypothetical protein n=1 Tax=Streptosporangium sp. NPDC020072 TaxID=3154788 RepID=UPI003441F490
MTPFHASIGPWRHVHTDGADVDTHIADVTMTFRLRAHGAAPTGFAPVAEELADLLGGMEFEVRYDPIGDPNGYQTLEIVTSREG